MMIKGFLSGIGMGAGLMYFFDPEMGRRRRALVRDQIIGTINELEEAMDAACRDLTNRSMGVVAEIGGMFTDVDVPDRVLGERIRAKMGRYVSHPSSIEVSVHDGHVTLTGPILASEVEGFVETVKGMPGVRGVENRLDVHQEAGNVPGLQGGRERVGEVSDVMQQTWTPGVRVLVGLAGLTLISSTLRRPSLIGSVMALLGTGMMARSISNSSMNQMLGMERQGGGQSPSGGARRGPERAWESVVESAELQG